MTDLVPAFVRRRPLQGSFGRAVADVLEGVSMCDVSLATGWPLCKSSAAVGGRLMPHSVSMLDLAQLVQLFGADPQVLLQEVQHDADGRAH